MRVGLVQINAQFTWSQPNEAVGRETPWAGALPYSVGLLQAYAERHSSVSHEFLPFVFTRLPVAEAVDQLAAAELVGFSTYVWNARLSQRIAAELKRQHPEILIVFGGPHVPDRSEQWLREHPYVDLVCHGEGEAVFTKILERAPTRDWTDVPGISFLREDGSYELHAAAPRIADMIEIPSPYLEGTFQPLLDAHAGERWVLMWETNRGCPFSCSFCDWGSAVASKVHRFDLERLLAEIEWMGQNDVGFLWVCDANYGMLKRDYELIEALAESKERTGLPLSLCVQNAKNVTDRAFNIQKLLHEKFHTQRVTISMQSINPGTLENIRRSNISSDAYRDLQRRFAAEGVYTYTDLILGLPGETYSDFADGISQVIADGQHNQIVVYNCSVLPNAEMGDPAYQARYGLQTVPQMLRDAYDPADLRHEVEELIDTVVATDAMPHEDWVRARVFFWLTDLFYFDRTLQIPLALLAARCDLSVRMLVEHLAASERPVLADLRAVLSEHARGIQAGGPQFFAAPEWGNVLWPGDQHALVRLVVNEQLDAMYAEAAAELEELLRERGAEDEVPLLQEALELNRALLCVPGESGTLRLALSHNVWEVYRGILVGADVPLEEGLYAYVIDRSSWRSSGLGAWFHHLAWCDNLTKHGYLHDARPLSLQAAAVA